MMLRLISQNFVGFKSLNLFLILSLCSTFSDLCHDEKAFKCHVTIKVLSTVTFLFFSQLISSDENINCFRALSCFLFT